MCFSLFSAVLCEQQISCWSGLQPAGAALSALGSIRLRARASHSSQCHKLWLVLTTALQGDGLIGLIASERLGWTLNRKAAATVHCVSSSPFSTVCFSHFFFFFNWQFLAAVFLHFKFLSALLLLHPFILPSLAVYRANFKLSRSFSALYFSLFQKLTSAAALHTNYRAKVKLKCHCCHFYLFSYPAKLHRNDGRSKQSVWESCDHLCQPLSNLSEVSSDTQTWLQDG